MPGPQSSRCWWTCAGEPSFSQGNSSWGAGDFGAKCGDILSAVQQHLGVHAAIFGAPVDVSMYPDYPRFVSHPMDLGTVRARLDRREYSNPQDFCDVSPLWLLPPQYCACMHGTQSTGTQHLLWG